MRERWGMRTAVLYLLVDFASSSAASSADASQDAADLASEAASAPKYTVVMNTATDETTPANKRQVIMTDKNGKMFACYVPKIAVTSDDDSDTKEAEAAEDTPEEPAAAEPPRLSMDQLLAPLEGKCLQRNEGYWSYEVCHKDRIRQFHHDADTQTAYSLGEYKMASGEGTDSNSMSYAGYKFAGGTRCDETNAGRNAEVRFVCAEGQTEHTVHSIEEVEVCRYVIYISTPLLCESNRPGKASAVAKPNTAESFLSSLNNQCFLRVDGWWTYEVCHKKHVRQFHQENDQVQQEYFLGLYDTDKNPTGGAASPADSSGGFSMFYTNGTFCDLIGEKRQTEVVIKCANDAPNLIESVKERSTCSYVVAFYTPAVCGHPFFQNSVQEDPLEHIQCSPLPPTHSAYAKAAVRKQEYEASESRRR